jgi:hypothetical protein
MKKIIAASAGLLLVGTMVTAASADVTFTGDSRERLMMKEKYSYNDNQNDYAYGRVRLMMNATTKGGAFANVRMSFGNSQDYGSPDASNAFYSAAPPATGQGSAGGTGIGSTYKAGSTVTSTGLDTITDWAYMGIPIGPVTLTAGRMPDFTDVWFRFDKRLDAVAATYATKNTSVTALFAKIYESQAATSQAAQQNLTPYVLGAADAHEDRDVNQWAVIAKQNFIGGWSGLFYGIYQDNQLGDVTAKYTNATTGATSIQDVSFSGFKGTVKAEGPAGPVKLLGELSYAQKSLSTNGMTNSIWYDTDNSPIYKNGIGQVSDAYGGIFHAKMDFGPAAGTFVLGFTRNGFQADGNYGFLMMGGAMAGTNPDIPGVGSPITAVNRIGQNPVNANYSANTVFVGLIGDYQINKMYKLVGILADSSVTGYGNLVELSGMVNIAVTDGAYINLGGGILGKSLSQSLNSASNNPDVAGMEYATAVGKTYTSTHNDVDYAVFTEFGVKF